MQVDVVIPARNEEENIGEVLQLFTKIKCIKDIIVVDNASTDNTKAISEKYTNHVLYEPRIGKGFALRAGFREATAGYIMACDGDISGLTVEQLTCLIEFSKRTNYMLTRLHINRTPEYAPLTYLVANPLIEKCFPGFQRIDEPLGGIFLVKRSFVLENAFPSNWGVDVSLSLNALERKSYGELKIEGVSHRKKPITDYLEMSKDVIDTIVEYYNTYKINNSE